MHLQHSNEKEVKYFEFRYKKRQRFLFKAKPLAKLATEIYERGLDVISYTRYNYE